MKITSMPQRAMNYKERQHGASLLEGVAYLGIAALVLIGAVSLVAGAFSSARSNRALEELVALRTAVNKLYSGQVYPADLVPALVAAGAIPGTMTINAGPPATIQNGFGGAVTITANAATADNDFSITYPNLPADVCVSIISGAAGWRQIAVNGAAALAAPITAAAASAACNAANANSIVFTAV